MITAYLRLELHAQMMGFSVMGKKGALLEEFVTTQVIRVNLTYHLATIHAMKKTRTVLPLLENHVLTNSSAMV
jgi:hypothetical protein